MISFHFVDVIMLLADRANTVLLLIYCYLRVFVKCTQAQGCFVGDLYI